MRYCDPCAISREYPMRKDAGWHVCDVCGTAALCSESTADTIQDRDLKRAAKKRREAEPDTEATQ